MTQKPEGFVEHCVHGVILGVCLHCANAALRARLCAAEDRCDEHVAAMLEIADVLDAADGETALEAVRRQMEWRRQGLRVLCEIHEALQGHGRLGESSADCIRRLAARVAELEKILPPMEQRHVGPGQGSWSVFAGQVVEERDALRQQVAALEDALVGMTRSVHRCYEHNDDLGDAMDLAKAVLRAAGRKT